MITIIHQKDVQFEEGLYTCTATLGEDGVEYFQVVADRNPDLLLYPSVPGARLDQGWMCGPDDKGQRMFWAIVGKENQSFKITLDMRPGVDRSKAVTWVSIAEPEPLPLTEGSAQEATQEGSMQADGAVEALG